MQAVVLVVAAHLESVAWGESFVEAFNLTLVHFMHRLL